MFGTIGYSAHYPRRNVNPKSVTTRLIYNGVLNARYARAMVGTNLMGASSISELAYDPLHKMQPSHNTVWVTENQKLGSPGA